MRATTADMHRRALLASLGWIAGCAGRPHEETTGTGDTGTDHVSPTGDPVPPGSVVRRPAMRYLRTDDAIGVDRPELDQFALVRVADGRQLERSGYALGLDGNR